MFPLFRHNIVPCDYDTSVVCARFSNERLAVGFGSFSDRRDGGIALWDMAEVCGTPTILEIAQI